MSNSCVDLLGSRLKHNDPTWKKETTHLKHRHASPKPLKHRDLRKIMVVCEWRKSSDQRTINGLQLYLSSSRPKITRPRDCTGTGTTDIHLSKFEDPRTQKICTSRTRWQIRLSHYLHHPFADYWVGQKDKSIFKGRRHFKMTSKPRRSVLGCICMI